MMDDADDYDVFDDSGDKQPESSAAPVSASESGSRRQHPDAPPGPPVGESGAPSSDDGKAVKPRGKVRVLVSSDGDRVLDFLSLFVPSLTEEHMQELYDRAVDGKGNAAHQDSEREVILDVDSDDCDDFGSSRAYVVPRFVRRARDTQQGMHASSRGKSSHAASSKPEQRSSSTAVPVDGAGGKSGQGDGRSSLLAPEREPAAIDFSSWDSSIFWDDVDDPDHVLHEMLARAPRRIREMIRRGAPPRQWLGVDAELEQDDAGGDDARGQPRSRAPLSVPFASMRQVRRKQRAMARQSVSLEDAVAAVSDMRAAVEQQGAGTGSTSRVGSSKVGSTEKTGIAESTIAFGSFCTRDHSTTAKGGSRRNRRSAPSSAAVKSESRSLRRVLDNDDVEDVVREMIAEELMYNGFELEADMFSDLVLWDDSADDFSHRAARLAQLRFDLADTHLVYRPVHGRDAEARLAAHAEGSTSAAVPSTSGDRSAPDRALAVRLQALRAAGALELYEETAADGMAFRTRRDVRHRKVVEHSLPSVQLALNAVGEPRVWLKETELRQHHRPRVTFPVGVRIPIRLQRKTRSHLRPGDVYRSIDDLSALNGELSVWEFAEEHPLFIDNVGMATRLVVKRRVRAGEPDVPRQAVGADGLASVRIDAEEPFAQFEALPQGEGVHGFVGDFVEGRRYLCAENNMYLAPAACHPAAMSDFVLTIPRGSDSSPELRLRRAWGVLAIGQEQPKLPVPAPESKGWLTFLDNRLETFVYRRLASDGCVSREELLREFPTMTSTYVERKLKNVVEYDEYSNVYRPAAEFTMPSEEKLRALCSPEDQCAFESAMAARQRLIDLGIREIQALTQKVTESMIETYKVYDTKEWHDTYLYIERHVMRAPWTLTQSFLAAVRTTGKIHLNLNAPVDPIGLGEGFSFARPSGRRMVEDKGAEKDAREHQPANITMPGELRITKQRMKKLSTNDARRLLARCGEDPKRWETAPRVEVLRALEQLSSGEVEEERPRPVSNDSVRARVQRTFESQYRFLQAEKGYVSSDSEADDDREEKEWEAEITGAVAAGSVGKEQRDLEDLRSATGRRGAPPLGSGQAENGASAPGTSTTVQDKNTVRPDHLRAKVNGRRRIIKIRRTVKQPDGSYATEVEQITDPELVEVYLELVAFEQSEEQKALVGGERMKHVKRLRQRLRRLKQEARQEGVLVPLPAGSDSEASDSYTSESGDESQGQSSTAASSERGHSALPPGATGSRVVLPHASTGNGSDKKSLVVKLKARVLTPARSGGGGSGSRKRQGGRRAASDSETSDGAPERSSGSARRKRRLAAETTVLDLNAALEEIYTALVQAECSTLFQKPVRRRDAPDYNDVVNNPMDLQRVKAKLSECKYKSKEEFLKDIELIASNAHLYNDLRHPHIPPLADQLVNLCQEEIRKREDLLDRIKKTMTVVRMV